MNKFFIVCLALLIPCAGFLAADWKALDNNRGESPLQVKLLSSTDNEIKVEITIPGYYEKLIKIGDKECVMIHIPGSSQYMKRGYPMVPKLTKLVKIHHDCNVKMEVLSKEEVEVELTTPIVPSKGHFSRNINPADVPFQFGPIYQKDVYWPSEKEQFQAGKRFEWRDNCGLRLRVLPIRANHVQMKMKVLKKAVISFKIEHDYATRLYSVAAESAVQPTRTYQRLYSDAFINYQPQERTYSVRGGSIPNPNNHKLVVVTPAKFEKDTKEWVTWKKKSGYQVTVHTVNDGVTASEIKTYLQGLYNNNSTRFSYVVLVGDANYNSNFENCQPMPTFKGSKEGAAADIVYVRLAGDDNYPDAFISRISGNNSTEIKNQFDKIVDYEKNPKKGDWFNKGVCIASNQGSPADKERAEWLQNGGGKSQKVPIDKTGLSGYGYTNFDDIYDPYAYAEDVSTAVNNGRSIICYIGHGSATSWGTTGFSVSDIHGLKNNEMYPVIWSVACVNGKFVHTGECFGEAWLRQANGGAVAIECASTNESWVPPCDKQAATVNSIINRRYFTFGAQEAAGCIKGLEVWGDGNYTEGNKMAEQCNLFGDCTMLVRTQQPQEVTVTVSRALDSVEFVITGQMRNCDHTVVSVYSEDMSYMVSQESENGRVSLNLSDSPKCQLFYSVVGSDIVPIVDQPVE